MTLADWTSDIRTMVMFFTRLPVKTVDDDTFDFTRALRAAPLAGLVVGGCGGGVFAVSSALGIAGMAASTLAVMAMVALAGGLHEDALADVADGFGGGTSVERKLEIMRDSTIGAYGACAIVLVVLLKVSVLNEIATESNGVWTVVTVMLAAAAISRGACVALLCLIPPARADGVSYDAGRPDASTLREIAGMSALTGGLCIFTGVGLVAALVALGTAACATWLVKRLALAQIGGHTGDVAGFCQQVVECTVLVATLVVMGL